MRLTQTSRTRARRPALGPAALSLLALTTLGCRDDRDEVVADGSTSFDPTLTTTISPETSTGTPDTTETTAPDPDTSSTGAPPLPTCETTQCGTDCCEAGDECVLGVCLPPCASAVRCGDMLDVCCESGDVCLQPNCVTPGAPCLDSYDCPDGEFCEPTLNQCLPNQDPVACEIIPEFTNVELTLEWAWETDAVHTMPLIGDVDGGNDTEVIIQTRDTATTFEGDIVILDGMTGQEKVRTGDDPANGQFRSYIRPTSALGDVDGNGLADIIYAGLPTGAPGTFNYSLIHAINGQGQLIWTSHNTDNSDHYLYARNGSIYAANLDDDAETEFGIGIGLIDHDGLVVSDVFNNEQNHGSGGFGGQNSYVNGGSMATPADIDGDGTLEIVTGRDAFKIDSWVNPAIGTPTVTVSQLWAAGGDDGYPAVADLDGNGTPEIILVSANCSTCDGILRILDSATGELWCGADPTGAACAGNDAARTQPVTLAADGLGGVVGRGGPPTVADFDGDGRPEVGVAGATAYAVYDFNRTDEVIVQPDGALPPGPGDAYIRWSAVTQDLSSNVTGSSVFDFQGDGIAEVLYQDECYAWVYDGETGDVLVQVENSSPTIHEYPVVADVDGDGNSEFVVIAAATSPASCEGIPGYQIRQGVFVYGDANDRWVRTRAVWPQHTYHVTNSTSAAIPPEVEEPNWLAPGLNNFRQNAQGEGIFNGPDLSIDVAVGLQNCLDEEFEIFVTVRNEGSIGVPAGIPVSLWEGTDSNGTLIGTQETEAPLLPGAFVQFSWLVPAPAEVAKNYYTTVDQAEVSLGEVIECIEDNNEAVTETVNCPTPG